MASPPRQNAWSLPMWHDKHRQYYCYKYDENGNPEYRWLGSATQADPGVQSTQAVGLQASSQQHSRNDSLQWNSPQQHESSSSAARQDSGGTRGPLPSHQQLTHAIGAYPPSASASSSYGIATIGQAPSYTYPPPQTQPPYHSQLASGAQWQQLGLGQIQQQDNKYLGIPTVVAQEGPKEKGTHLSAPDLSEDQTQLLEKKLHPSYATVAPQSQKAFFCVGRVFRTPWVEPTTNYPPADANQSDRYTIGWLGEASYSEIRIFVVIKNQGRNSIVVPIQSYGGNGLGRKHFSANEICNHAIAYTGHDGQLAPGFLQEEINKGVHELVNKDPLRLEPSKKNYKESLLTNGSRINFGKTYTFEHNLKVLDMGKIAREQRHLLPIYHKDAL